MQTTLFRGKIEQLRLIMALKPLLLVMTRRMRSNKKKEKVNKRALKRRRLKKKALPGLPLLSWSGRNLLPRSLANHLLFQVVLALVHVRILRLHHKVMMMFLVLAIHSSKHKNHKNLR